MQQFLKVKYKHPDKLEKKITKWKQSMNAKNPSLREIGPTCPVVVKSISFVHDPKLHPLWIFEI